jgi:hypothetical protein
MGLDLPVDEIREHARRSALAGREIFCNPHLGDDAVLWFDGYRGVAVTANPKTATPRPWGEL